MYNHIGGKPFTLFALGMAYERFSKKHDYSNREKCYSILKGICSDDLGICRYILTASNAEFIYKMEQQALEEFKQR